MFKNLLTRIRRALAPQPDSIAGSRACSYDCYEDGGCNSCAIWVEWEDEEYGLIGTYVHPVDRLNAHVTLDEWIVMQTRKEV